MAPAAEVERAGVARGDQAEAAEAERRLLSSA